MKIKEWVISQYPEELNDTLASLLCISETIDHRWILTPSVKRKLQEQIKTITCSIIDLSKGKKEVE